MTPFTPSPTEIRHHREALKAFSDAYIAYLTTPTPEARLRAIQAMPEAQEALQIGGGGPTFWDPPAMGAYRKAYRGLAATAFLHEQRGWADAGGRPPYDHVLEGLASVDAVLAAAERQASKARKSPLYWLDRCVRIVLMLPAYLVGVILGESVSSIDRSSWGPPLRVIGLAADALGIWVGGQALGIW